MNIGDTFSQDVENVVLGRIETQAARQVMMQKVREAERDTIVAMFKSQDNSLMSGTVKRVTRDNIIVDIGNDVEAIPIADDSPVLRSVCAYDTSSPLTKK